MSSSVLLLYRFFAPSKLSGGPVKSLVNLVVALKNEFHFSAITSNSDLNSGSCYSPEELTNASKATSTEIIALNINFLFPLRVVSVLVGKRYDVYYFNSFFDVLFTLLPLIVLRFINRSASIIIAPRGQLGADVINSKNATAKNIYIRLIKNIIPWSCVIWHVTSMQEKAEILDIFGNVITERNVYLAPNIILDMDASLNLSYPKCKEDTHFKIVYLGRINRKKNLIFTLDILNLLKIDKVLVFHIYGPIDDSEYWNQCLESIKRINFNVTIEYRGSIDPDDVLDVLRRYDLFIMPTLNENFGHAILESLQAGTPVLISDQTPWASADDMSVTALPLSFKSAWIDTITKFSALSGYEQHAAREAARRYFDIQLNSRENIRLHKELFYEASCNC